MRNYNNEAVVARAFDNQSCIFDELYDSNYLVNYSRNIIRAELLRQLPVGGEVLELNAGTGTDAIFLGSRGFRVQATDISERMVSVMKQKVIHHRLTDVVTTRQCSFWDIEELDQKKYDLVYSNFGGLNCTDHLDKLLLKIVRKVKPGGKAVLVLMPVLCPWERAMILFGNTKIAFRRRRGKSTRAHIEGEYFDVWYHNASDVVKAIEGKATLIRQQSLSLFVPPSAYRTFDKKYPRLLSWLERFDAACTLRWPFRNWGDYLILTLEKPRLSGD
jgi:ubiquinone/menaquinone biosynthesis C-methylase UbiE